MPVVDTVREECPPARVDSRAQRAEQGHGLRTQEACTFWKGRTALYAVLRSLEVSQGDTVLVPGYTCFAVPSAVMFTGARPVFADIDPNTFNVSLQTILKALAQTSSRTVKAVVVQHTYGIPADIRPILDWARYQTPVKGLFLCSNGTHPGNGLTGASGANAAKEIIHELR